LHQVYGCTDTYAGNYNPDANADDGSCAGYPDNGNYTLSFDGQGDHVVVNNFEGSFSTFSFTTRAFINSESLPWRTLFYFGVEAGGDNTYTRTIDLGISNDGLRIHLNYDYGQVGTQDFTTDAWVDIAGVFDNGQLSLYIDGNQVGSEQTNVNSINLESTAPNNFIGAGFSGSQQSIASFFDGQIDNLAFWDIPLDENAINYYRDSTITGQEEGLISYWSFNSGSGDIAYDHSGGQSHGDINGV
jgi:hypothetical protein